MRDHKQARGIYFLARSVVSLWLPNVIERNKRCSKMLSLRYIADTPRLAGFYSQSFFCSPPLSDYLNWRFKNRSSLRLLYHRLARCQDIFRAQITTIGILYFLYPFTSILNK